MAYGQFIQLSAEGKSSLLKRLPLGDSGGRSEAWLRDTLHAHPALIPVEDIDRGFGPLIPVCTELRTAAGPIDNVFIDHHGRLTMVECKLWRNPEARRKVVAQILDYAKEVSQWSYADLQRQVSARTGQHGNVLYEMARRYQPDLVEHHFADAVAQALRTGRFLLLIVGDGIREDVRAIGNLINRNAAAAFSFAMIEVALYDAGEGALLVQPRVLARTQLLERTVVIVQGGERIREVEDEVETQSQATSSSASDVANKIHAQAAAWWEPILATPLDDPDQPPFKYHWPNHIRGPLPWPGTWILGYRSSGASPKLGVFLRGREVALAELIAALAPQAQAILGALPEGVEFDESGILGVERDARSFSNDEARRAWLASTINAFVNTLRPRVERLRDAKEVE